MHLKKMSKFLLLVNVQDTPMGSIQHRKIIIANQISELQNIGLRMKIHSTPINIFKIVSINCKQN